MRCGAVRCEALVVWWSGEERGRRDLTRHIQFPESTHGKELQWTGGRGELSHFGHVGCWLYGTVCVMGRGRGERLRRRRRIGSGVCFRRSGEGVLVPPWFGPGGDGWMGRDEMGWGGMGRDRGGGDSRWGGTGGYTLPWLYCTALQRSRGCHEGG